MKLILRHEKYFTIFNTYSLCPGENFKVDVTLDDTGYMIYILDFDTDEDAVMFKLKWQI
jgi:hypothetical protein